MRTSFWARLRELCLLLLVAACGGEATAEGEASCSTYRDESVTGGSVSLRFVNQRSEPIFFIEWEGCPSWGSLYTMQAPSGTNVGPAAFGMGCSYWQDNGSSIPTGCETMRLTAVAPGGTHAATWEALVYEPRPMPSRCFAGEEHSPCTQALAATDGSYVFTAIAHTAAEGCDAVDTCPCEGPAQGSCSVSGATMSGAGEKLSASATAAYPGTAQVDIVFE